LAGITQEKTKYNHALTVLFPEAANEVSDIITDTKPSDETPYTKLKNAIITRLSQTETQKLKELLSNCELGSRKPTQLVRHAKTLVGAGPTKPVNDQVLRELFLQNMPHADRASARFDLRSANWTIFKVHGQKTLAIDIGLKCKYI
jgi:hypothetical protein